MPPMLQASPYLRHQLERHLLAAAADPDRRVGLLHALRLVDRPAHLVILALERGVVLRPHGVDDLQRLAQHPQALRAVGVRRSRRRVYSCSYQPAPMPKSSRPWLITSTVEAIFASSAGLR